MNALEEFQKICQIHCELREVHPYAYDQYSHTCNIAFVLLAGALLETHGVKPTEKNIDPNCMSDAVGLCLQKIYNRYKHGGGKWKFEDPSVGNRDYWQDFINSEIGNGCLVTVRERYQYFRGGAQYTFAQQGDFKDGSESIISLDIASTIEAIKQELPGYVKKHTANFGD